MSNKASIENADDADPAEGTKDKLKFRDNKSFLIKKLLKDILVRIWDNKNKRFISRDFLSWGNLTAQYNRNFTFFKHIF